VHGAVGLKYRGLERCPWCTHAELTQYGRGHLENSDFDKQFLRRLKVRCYIYLQAVPTDCVFTPCRPALPGPAPAFIARSQRACACVRERGGSGGGGDGGGGGWEGAGISGRCYADCCDVVTDVVAKIPKAFEFRSRQAARKVVGQRRPNCRPKTDKMIVAPQGLTIRSAGPSHTETTATAHAVTSPNAVDMDVRTHAQWSASVRTDVATQEHGTPTSALLKREQVRGMGGGGVLPACKRGCA
jgi:hypothetical protein